MFAFVEIPQHGLAVLASGRAERTVGRNGDGVQISSVPDVVRLQLAVGQIPDLEEGRGTKEEGRRRDEGRRTDEGGGTKEEGREMKGRDEGET